MQIFQMNRRLIGNSPQDFFRQRRVRGSSWLLYHEGREAAFPIILDFIGGELRKLPVCHIVWKTPAALIFQEPRIQLIPDAEDLRTRRTPEQIVPLLRIFMEIKQLLPVTVSVDKFVPFPNLVWGKKMQAKNENFVRKKSKKYFALR